MYKRQADNLYIDLLFDAGVYGDSESGTAVAGSSFTVTPSDYGVGEVKAVVDGLEDAVTAGASVIRVYLTGTGSEDGSESLSVTVAEGSVYDGAGNAAPHADGVGVSAVSTGLVDLFDLAPPVLSLSLIHI